MEKQETFLRSILKNEITWLIGLIMAVMAFTYNIIIPLNSLQLQLVQIQQDISQIKGYDARITQNANDIIILQQEFKNINR